MLYVINTIKINSVNGLVFDCGVAFIFLFQPKGRKSKATEHRSVSPCLNFLLKLDLLKNIFHILLLV